MRSRSREMESRSRDDAPLPGQERVFRELHTALAMVAADPVGSGREAAGEVLERLNHQEQATAHEIISFYIAVDRARNVARKGRRPARYDWRAWAEVSRLAGEWLIAAVQAMRERVAAGRAAYAATSTIPARGVPHEASGT